MKTLIPGEHYFGVMCSSCSSPILLEETNNTAIDEGFRVTCSNFRCGNPVNDYKLEKLEHFQARR
jgi:hypothetical protein